MSTAPATHLERADHAGAELDGTVEEFRRTLASGLVDYAGHYAHWSWDFSVDRLGESELAPDRIADRRRLLRKVGAQFSREFADLDEQLLGLDTGRLIRSVLQGPDGVLFCNAVVPLRHAVAFRLGTPESEPAQPLTRQGWLTDADKVASNLADRLREKVSLQSLNPGGWYTEELDAQPVGSLGGIEFIPRIEGDVDDRLKFLCEPALGEAYLHYLAYSVDGTVEFSMDCFQHPSLIDYFTQLGVDDRRVYCRKTAEGAASLGSELGRMTEGALGRRLDRIVLDVEQGAFFYYRVGIGRWLVGMTMRQDRVSQADDTMAELTQLWGQRS